MSESVNLPSSVFGPHRAKEASHEDGTGFPQGWEWSTIGEATDLLTGFPFPSKLFTETGVRLLRGSNVKRGVLDWSEEILQHWRTVSFDLTKYLLRESDLVIAMDGALVGRSYAVVSRADLPCLLVQRVARVRGRKLNQKLISYFVGSDRFARHVDSVKTQTAIPHISPADIRSFTIAMPLDPEEQSAIAAALSDVDALISGLNKLIAKKNAIKLAASQQLLSGEIRLPGFGCTEQKRNQSIPSSRDQVTVSSLCTNIIDFRGRTPRKLGMCWGGGDIPALSAANVKMGGIDLNEDTNFGSEALYRRWMTNGEPRKGDVVMTTEAPLGNVTLIPDDRKYILSQRTILLQLKRERASGAFVLHMMSSEKFQRTLQASSSGSTATGIQRSKFEKLRLLMPPVDEQQAIAEVLSTMDAEVQALARQRNKMQALKQAMMQQLLTGRIRLMPPEVVA